MSLVIWWRLTFIFFLTGWKYFHAPSRAGSLLPGKQLCRENPVSAGKRLIMNQQCGKEASVSQAVLGQVLPAGRGRGSFPSAQHWWGPSGKLYPCWASQYRRDKDRLEQGSQSWQKNRSLCDMRRGWGKMAQEDLISVCRYLMGSGCKEEDSDNHRIN